MGYSYGDIHYDYNIRIDLSSFFAAILEKIDGWDDYEFDGDTLLIYGSSKDSGKSYYCPATMWEPAEEEIEFTGDTIEDLNYEQIVIDACNKFRDDLIQNDRSVGSCEIDSESCEFEADEPDDDNDAYDRWRDRQLEED